MFVKTKNDVKGLLVQMHHRRKNARIIGWVGGLFESFFADLMSSQFVAADLRKKRMSQVPGI